MPYRFALSETPQDGLRRIAREQVRRTIARLAAETGDASTVHEMRKSLKRLKALLKLVRSGLPKQIYAREYAVVRDIARSLSGARDLDVMPVTLAALATSRDASDLVRSAIARAQAQQMPDSDRQAHIATAARHLKAASARYGKLRLSNDTFTVLEQGAARGLQLLRRQHDLAVASGEDEAYHDWRKSAQLHWRHLRLLSATWPVLMEERTRATKCLAAVLGHDHDLSVLASFIRSASIPRLRSADRKTILSDIEDRQQALRAEARACAGLLVIDTPKRFAAHLRAYHAAHREFTDLRRPHGNLFKR
ncbi:MAG: CHAD domain-containing protein [Hyphomicrobiaceae bacterium]